MSECGWHGSLRCFHAAAPLKPRRRAVDDGRVDSPLLSRSGPIEAVAYEWYDTQGNPLRCFHAAAPLKPFAHGIIRVNDRPLRCFHAAAPLKLLGFDAGDPSKPYSPLLSRSGPIEALRTGRAV